MNRTPEEIYAELLAKAWSDPAFKTQLLANPAEVLKEHGLEVPEGKQVVVVEDTPTTMHFVLPEKPGNDHVNFSSFCTVAHRR